MGRKVQLRLMQSVSMSEKGENHLIRFPKKAREYFGFGNDMVVVGKGEYELSLKSKKAYKQDVQRLARMLRDGKIDDADALQVGFVTRSIHQRVTKKAGSSVWISEGVGNITIGADPEFGLIDLDGVLHRGSTVLPHTQTSKFGADGPGVEVRPKPTRDHIALVRNIQKILEKPPVNAESYSWRGGATHKDKRVYWFGGHIHLGRPDFLDPGTALPAYQKIASILDATLAFPLVAFDTPDPFLRRNGCKYAYGKAGDIRADYPEQDRFEYRVLSGLWLTHPTLAKVALGVAKCVTETAYNRISATGCDPEYIQAPASRKGLLRDMKVKGFREIQGIINQAQPSKLKPELIENWIKQLKAVDRGDMYREEIAALIELTKISPENVVPQLSLDIRDNWLEGKPCLPKAPARLRKTLEAVEAKQ